MPEHDPSAYGEQVAGAYDELYDALPDTDDAVARLAELAGPDGRVLELGIGTGRLALPLAARGIEVAGIEGSPAMVAQLSQKPGGDQLVVTVGNFIDTVVEGDFSLVILALNTVFALPSQDDQVRCFANAARHLGPGGRFVVEAFVLDPARFAGGSAIEPRIMEEDHVELQVSRYDPVTQRVTRRLIHLRATGVHIVPVDDRYASPAELDLMASMAGLRLAARWGDWRAGAFTAASARHVSVYERPA